MAEIKVVKVKEGNGTRTYWQYDGKNYGSEKQAQEAKRKAEEFKFGSSPQQANIFGQHATGQSLHGTFTAGSLQDPSFALQVADAVDAAQSGSSPNGARGATNSGAGGGGGFTPIPAAPAGTTFSDQDMRDTYPAWGAFLDIPEIANILRLAMQEGWPQEKLQARIQATEWWRSTPAQARQWLALEATDPATAKRKVTEATESFKKLSRDYLVPVADITAQKWALDILSGKVDEKQVRDYMTEQATSLFPGLAAALQQGITVRQYADPYVQVAARELEVAPESIDLLDGKWNRALNTVDKDGNRVSMSLSEWQSTLRSDPTYGWDRTAGARQQASQFATQLAQKFGRM